MQRIYLSEHQRVSIFKCTQEFKSKADHKFMPDPAKVVS